MRQRRSPRGHRGFTLIELLVVISIIALLIGILLPALGKARDAGKMAQNLSNIRQTAIALMTYSASNRQLFPTCYQYRSTTSFTDTNIGTSSATGYLQWSGVMIQGGYFEKGKGFVSPFHAPGGWAPTNFEPGTEPNGFNQAIQTPGVIDTQSPRLSYVPNEALLGRLKTQALQSGDLKLVSQDEIEKASGTILMAEYTSDPQAMKGNSATGGAAFKTHRPTNAVKVGTSTTGYDGEKADGVQGSAAAATGSVATDLRALTLAEADAAYADAAVNGSDTNHHIVYSARKANGDVVAYAFADGHAAGMRLEQTLDNTNWMWGLRMYSQKNKAQIKTADGTGVVQ